MNDPEECFAYAEHLHHEHRRLNQLLRDINHEVAQLGQAVPDARTAQLAKRIDDFRWQLQKHFAEEESGGCLKEAVTRCPSLGTDAKAILEEHPQLDRMLEQIEAQASDPGTKPSEIQQKWETFSKKVHAHEAAETRLLQMAFGAEAADLDVEGDE
jgi:hemerythrin